MRRTMIAAGVLALGLAVGGVGCSGDDGDGDDASDETGGDGDGDGDGATIECVDEVIQSLNLLDDRVSEGEVTNAPDGDDVLSGVDASAGGSTTTAPEHAWLYLRFGDDGLEKVDLDDVAALSSTQWHIAAKRYFVRVNSGYAGPGAVAVAIGDGDYASLDTVPDAGAFMPDAFLDAECNLIEDGSGLPGNPNFVMTPWWSYISCVETTFVPFVLHLEDDRYVKLVIEEYYGQGQEGCNADGMRGDDAGFMTWRWRDL